MKLLISALFACLSLATAALAGPGHDHGPEPAAAATPAVPRLVAEGSDVELVATPNDHKLTIYLDRKATNEPVVGAKIDVMGEGVPSSTAKDLGNGIYEIEGEWLHEPGAKALTFAISVNDDADLLAGVLPIAEAHDDHGAASFWSSLLARPELWLLAVTMVLGGFFLGFAFRPLRVPSDAEEHRSDNGPVSLASVARSLKRAAQVIVIGVALVASAPQSSRAHEGDDHGDEAPAAATGTAPAKLPTGEVFLPKASQRLLHVRTTPAAIEKAQGSSELVGTVIADPSHEGRVQAPMDGQIELASGQVSFVGKPVKEGDILALLAPAMPVYDRGTLQQVTAEVEGKLRIAEQKLQRLSRISGDYIPQREIDDTKTEIESLREQKRVLEPKSGERLELKAPVSGIISIANVRPGQVVNTRDTLFEIVDPQKLWIEAIGMRGRDDDNVVATAVAVDAEGHRIPLTYVGRSPALRQQALPMLFRVDEPHASLGIGGTIKVLVQHGEPVDAIVVPEAAVVRATNGLAQVWVKVAPERFAAKPVRTRPLDGERVIVTSGLGTGDRVVVEAAELINQVR